MSSLVEDLRDQISSGQAVVVVGAGVSIGATNGGAVASWPGLLHHGIARCLELPTTGLTKSFAKSLDDQIDSGDIDLMLGAASIVSSKLGAPSGGEWGRWLRESVGSLDAHIAMSLMPCVISASRSRPRTTTA